MSFVSVNLQGGAALQAKLTGIKQATVTRIMKKAVTFGFAPTLTAAKVNALTMVGNKMGDLLAKFLTVVPFKKRRKGQIGYHLVIDRAGNQYFVDTTKKGERQYIPAAIEYGHVKRNAEIEYSAMAIFSKKERKKQRKKYAVKTGQFVAAIPFMRRATDSNLKKAPAIMGEVIRRELKKYEVA